MNRDEFHETILGAFYDLIACYLVHQGLAREVKTHKIKMTYDEALTALSR